MSTRRKNPNRAVSISDVAEAAGVSRATVSRVVNGLATVDPVISERVRATVAALNYVPNNTARSLSLGTTRTIGMIVPDLGNPMFQQILRGFARSAAQAGYRVLVADSQENAAEEAALVRETRKRADAVVLCAPRMDAGELSALLATVQPAVVINRETPGMSTPTVTVDYAGGIRALGEHLVSLGHRRLLYLAGPSNSASNRARVEGLNRLSADHPDIELLRVTCGPTMDDGYRSWEAVQDSRATAVLAFNDIVALGLLGRLHEVGVSVPSELSVTGFDDIEFSRFSSPPLTTMSVRQSEMGATAWEQLSLNLQGEEARATTTFRPELIVRQSTGVAR